MLDELRFRICVTDPDIPMMLHEGKLAQEFGVSRTPVRQVLQRLAFEHLLETRSGVGTVVSPLQRDQLDLHFLLLSDLLRLCERCCAPALTAPARVGIATVADLARTDGPDAAARCFTARAQLLELVSGLLVDPIIAEAHAATHWRAIRWRVHAARSNPSAATDELRTISDRLGMAGTPAAVLETLAGEAQPVNF